MIDFNDLVAQRDTRPKMYQSHWSGAAGVANSDDLRRIVKLPRRALELDGTERADGIIDAMTERFSRGPVKCKCARLDPQRHAADGCMTRLRLIQALALRELSICGGLLGIIGTGHGKTLLDLLAPLAMRTYNLNDFVLLVPPGLVSQLINDYEYAGQHFHMPQIVFHGTNYENKCTKMNSIVALERGAPTVHVVPYSRLSRPDATDWLEQRLRPDAFIADECFPAGTLITTDEGDLPIEEVVAGRAKNVVAFDNVSQQYVWRPILKRMAKPLRKELVRVEHSSGSFVCTADHKIWTVGGYVVARDLVVGQTLVRVQMPVLHEHVLVDALRGADTAHVSKVSSEGQGPARGGQMSEMSKNVSHETQGQDNSALLLQELRCQSCTEGQAEPETLSCKEIEPVRVCQERHDSSSSACEAARSHVSVARRERPTNETADRAVQSARSTGRGDGMAGENGTNEGSLRECPTLLQSRHRHPVGSSSDRGGRPVTQDQEMEISRPAQNNHPEISRVVSVTFLERGSDGGYGASCPGDQVYDLTIDDTHNYFANGILVSNCHKLRNIKGAGANRVKRYMEMHPGCYFAGWSGSVTSRKIGDVAHIAGWALKNASPLPLDPDNSMDWDRAVGAKGDPDYAGALLDLCEPGEKVRSGFKRRVLETVGVVSTSAPPVDCELRITEYTPPPIPEDVKQALRGVRGERKGSEGPERPDGEQLLDALSINRTAMQVACGFYYKFIFPKCEFPRDEALVADYLNKRMLWRCEVRQKLKKLEEHLDSPRLVQNAAERFWGDRPQLKGLPVWKSEHWRAYKAVHGTVEIDTQAVFLNDYLAKEVAKIALGEPQIIWYAHRAFGDWVHELTDRKVPIYGGGKDAKIAVLGDPARGIKGEDGSRSILLSLDAFGTGTNGLQRVYNKAGYPNPPSSPDEWEQSISRLVRIGQKSPSVTNWFVRNTRELKKTVDSALAAATYIEDGWGNQQKIVHGFELTEGKSADVEEEEY